MHYHNAMLDKTCSRVEGNIASPEELLWVQQNYSGGSDVQSVSSDETSTDEDASSSSDSDTSVL